MAGLNRGAGGPTALVAGQAGSAVCMHGGGGGGRAPAGRGAWPPPPGVPGGGRLALEPFSACWLLDGCWARLVQQLLCRAQPRSAPTLWSAAARGHRLALETPSTPPSFQPTFQPPQPGHWRLLLRGKALRPAAGHGGTWTGQTPKGCFKSLLWGAGWHGARPGPGSLGWRIGGAGWRS